MGERLLCKQEVVGSIPSASTGGGGAGCADASVTGRAPTEWLCGDVMEGESLGFGGWITAVGRGLALGA